MGITASRKPTRKDAEEVIRQGFISAVSWKAARTILVRVTEDPAYKSLDTELRGSIERFIERHP